jgi:hypothetical protein
VRAVSRLQDTATHPRPPDGYGAVAWSTVAHRNGVAAWGFRKSLTHLADATDLMLRFDSADLAVKSEQERRGRRTMSDAAKVEIITTALHGLRTLCGRPIPAHAVAWIMDDGEPEPVGTGPCNRCWARATRGGDT